jgi:hypothetical protein
VLSSAWISIPTVSSHLPSRESAPPTGFFFELCAVPSRRLFLASSLSCLRRGTSSSCRADSVERGRQGTGNLAIRARASRWTWSRCRHWLQMTGAPSGTETAVKLRVGRRIMFRRRLIEMLSSCGARSSSADVRRSAAVAAAWRAAFFWSLSLAQTDIRRNVACDIILDVATLRRGSSN